MFKVGIIGCGLIGSKRADAIIKKYKIISSYDLNKEINKSFSIKYNSTMEKSWIDVINNPDVDVVFICTPHNMLTMIAEEAIKINKPVFIEKPAGRNHEEIFRIDKLSTINKVPVHVGFNHRFHPSLIKAKNLIDDGTIGDLMFIRGRYGHGGRIGYNKEWRAKPEISGGGELIDQGSHLIDLSRWLLGDIVNIYGVTKTYFWDMEVEDNAFMILENKKGCVSHLQVSCTEWKNLFSFEIYGQTGKIAINGFGGSYGLETIHLYKMKPEMGPPDTICWEFPGSDNSWEIEVLDFFDCIKNNKSPSTTLKDAYECHKIIETIYNS